MEVKSSDWFSRGSRTASCLGVRQSRRSATPGARRSGIACLLALAALSTELNAQTTAVPPAAPAPASAAAPGATTAGPAGASPAAPAGAMGTAAPARPSPLNPTPAEFPSTSPAPSTSQLDALISRVAALRSRIAALASTMFSSKLRIEVRAVGDTVRLESMHVSVDGGVVYSAPSRAVFDQPAIVYEHAVAPGSHVVSIEVERHDARNPQFSTWQESRFVVLVPEKKLLWTRLELEDESSMAEDFEEDNEGQYQLRVKLLAEVTD
jgi:hypothetical protein